MRAISALRMRRASLRGIEDLCRENLIFRGVMSEVKSNAEKDLSQSKNPENCVGIPSIS